MSSTKQPTASRPLPPAPPVGRYRLLELLHAPNRILHPGQRIEKCLDKCPTIKEKYGGATAGKVRGTRVKLSEVTLDDVLQGRHTPPLTLRDFEDYLAFKEKSAENLYFHLWLTEYTKLYQAHVASERPQDESLLLGASFKTACDIFFAPQSPLELNVPSDIRRQLDGQIVQVTSASVASPKSETFLPPSAFDKCHHEASESLAVSFKAFIKQVSRNADRNRGWFAIFLGALTYLLGLIPTIVCTRLDAHRGFRAIGIPLWWFGIVVLVGGLRKTCLVIYLFGDNRQLYPWELAREVSAPSSASTHGTQSTWSHDSAENGLSVYSSRDEKAGFDGETAVGRTREPTNATFTSATDSRRFSSFSFPDLGYFPLGPRTSSVSGGSESSGANSQRPSTTPGGLYFAPAAVKLPSSSNVWARFTPILNPVVARAQRDIVLAAAGYGVVAAALTTAICLSVPNA
ncbi:uncharacterized protein JCM6883_005781 [Sporobolomyces salmoneus]|uniref:uncharacterized protein n=1 Tax=Sporobolomyces salmoneus TaxID=183962 RepID=UPI0031700964